MYRLRKFLHMRGDFFFLFSPRVIHEKSEGETIEKNYFNDI